jgi:hypothetical protein
LQGSGWLSLLSKIPRQKHDHLAIVTTTGSEIVLREIVRVENDFIIVRGRMAGSPDQGRVLVLPFDQITYLAFSKMMPEAEINAMFGQEGSAVQFKDGAPPSAETEAGAELTPAAPTEEAVAQGKDPATGAKGPAAPGAASGKGSAKPAPPSKSILLARLRARLANENGGSLPR